MSKTCARCEKTVYPIEELKCLDKVGILKINLVNEITHRLFSVPF